MTKVSQYIIKQRLKDNAIDRLKELADKSYQEKVWMALIPGVMSTFTEACCGLFDDSGLSAAFEKNETYFDEEIDARLKELSGLLNNISDQRPDMEIIEDPAMIPVRKMAAEILVLIERKDQAV